MLLPSAEHRLQSHREQNVALDAAATGDHYGEGILKARDHAHPVREADVNRRRGVKRRRLEQARAAGVRVDLDRPAPGCVAGRLDRVGLQLVGDDAVESGGVGGLEAFRLRLDQGSLASRVGETLLQLDIIKPAYHRDQGTPASPAAQGAQRA